MKGEILESERLILKPLEIKDAEKELKKIGNVMFDRD